MAESIEFGRSIDRGSDHVLEIFCEPCYEVDENIKPVAGYCQNCNENLCMKCYSGHLRRKLFQDHTLVDKSTKPKAKSLHQPKPHNLGNECQLHHGETVKSFCQGHSQFCCKVCLTIEHQACKTEQISKLARNIQGSQELQNLIVTLNMLKKGFNGNLSTTGANIIVIKKNHRNAINEMKKLQDEFDKLMTETEAQAERVKEEELDYIETIAATCNIVFEQINKLTANLEMLKETGEIECLFISMKRAESQLKALEGNQEKIEKENVGKDYKFKPDGRLTLLLKDLQVLGQLLFEKPGNAKILQPETINMSNQSNMPSYLKDITVTYSSDTHLYGSFMLPNENILVTDYKNQSCKLIDTNQDKIISEIQVSGKPFDIAMLKENEIAVTLPCSPKSKIQFVSVFQNSLSKGREISVNGQCRGIAYNARDQTLITATDNNPGKIQIIDMAGSVVKCLDNDSNGDNLFAWPRYVALSPNMTEMYVTDCDKHTVTLMTMNGDVKAVYQDTDLQNPRGICVNKAGQVYVVGYFSHTVHQLDTDSGTFKLLLCQYDGLYKPVSISYCDLEDTIYIGMENSRFLRVFQME